MKGLIVYHTKYGNGKIICESLAKGLTEAGHTVTLEMTDVKDLPDADFIVVSSPTRAGRMMGPVKHFISRELRKDSWKGKPFIAVGTGMRPEGTGKKTDEWGARSAEKVYATLVAAGLKPLMDAQKFFVSEMKGPLEDGEPERAEELGRKAGEMLK